jgi:hypothetical protein
VKTGPSGSETNRVKVCMLVLKNTYIWIRVCMVTCPPIVSDKMSEQKQIKTEWKPSELPGRFPEQFWGLKCGSAMGVRRGVRIVGCCEVRRGGSSWALRSHSSTRRFGSGVRAPPHVQVLPPQTRSIYAAEVGLASAARAAFAPTSTRVRVHRPAPQRELPGLASPPLARGLSDWTPSAAPRLEAS